eukprot:scaffold3165_cov29-Tisochrysis_lutea.AAC.5
MVHLWHHVLEKGFLLRAGRREQRIRRPGERAARWSGAVCGAREPLLLPKGVAKRAAELGERIGRAILIAAAPVHQLGQHHAGCCGLPAPRPLSLS